MEVYKKILGLCIVIIGLYACGGGGSSESSNEQVNIQQNSNSFDVSTWDNFFWE